MPKIHRYGVLEYELRLAALLGTHATMLRRCLYACSLKQEIGTVLIRQCHALQGGDSNVKRHPELDVDLFWLPARHPIMQSVSTSASTAWRNARESYIAKRQHRIPIGIRFCFARMHEQRLSGAPDPPTHSLSVGHGRQFGVFQQHERWKEIVALAFVQSSMRNVNVCSRSFGRRTCGCA
jgi:hypothetical protein